MVKVPYSTVEPRGTPESSGRNGHLHPVIHLSATANSSRHQFWGFPTTWTKFRTHEHQADNSMKFPVARAVLLLVCTVSLLPCLVLSSGPRRSLLQQAVEGNAKQAVKVVQEVNNLFLVRTSAEFYGSAGCTQNFPILSGSCNFSSRTCQILLNVLRWERWLALNRFTCRRRTASRLFQRV